MLVTQIGQDRERGWMEMDLVEEYFPGFTFHEEGGDPYVTGRVTPNGSSTSYQLRSDIPPNFPHQKPRLFVVSPVTLWKHGGHERINDEGFSHRFHTLGTGHGGCCEICHVGDWDASISLVKVLWMGVLWCEAYTRHLACGDDIDTCLQGLRRKARRD